MLCSTAVLISHGGIGVSSEDLGETSKMFRSKVIRDVLVLKSLEGFNIASVIGIVSLIDLARGQPIDFTKNVKTSIVWFLSFLILELDHQVFEFRLPES